MYVPRLQVCCRRRMRRAGQEAHLLCGLRLGGAFQRHMARSTTRKMLLWDNHRRGQQWRSAMGERWGIVVLPGGSKEAVMKDIDRRLLLTQIVINTKIDFETRKKALADLKKLIS